MVCLAKKNGMEEQIAIFDRPLALLHMIKLSFSEGYWARSVEK
jgi:hypothetical protein